MVAPDLIRRIESRRRCQVADAHQVDQRAWIRPMGHAERADLYRAQQMRKGRWWAKSLKRAASAPQEPQV